MKRDLLAELYQGVISLEEAHSVLDSGLESPEGGNVKEILGFTDIEYTAFCHGVGLMQVAAWRYEGWPTACGRCGQPLIIEKYGWWAKKENSRGKIYHIDCL